MKKYLFFLTLPLISAVHIHASDPFNDPFFNDPFGDDIFKEMMQMQQKMDDMFERMHQRMLQRTQRAVGPIGKFQLTQPQSTFVDKGDHYELYTAIPESKENHIDIKTENGMISITAKVIEEQEQKTANGIAKSQSVRVYQQALTLPADADESHITTRYEKGRLVVIVAKKNSASNKAVNNTSTQAPASSASLVKKADSNDSNLSANTVNKEQNNSSIKIP